ncbi:MAG TPA: 5-formyltetrahydrofolate cyclo-ligase [Candidatus Competibacteraceae bacterium]|nr:5-formyltetrahydrofolate cyclo-ligase [Candidatus Competibacteraceae bacterium]HRZ08080.1 5-formyltetrahydrofolate cyclo-ligase [Candidatus Competibacteraceae bacterium]HSA46210.1 5-formyltetrahydrofolate cyclo-ligase [Candidatus Competibacteraceae bacterium]
MKSPTSLLDALRQQLRAQRLLLSVAEQQVAALVVAHRLMEAVEFLEASTVAGYWACRGELNPAPLLEHAWAMDKAVYLPVLAGDALQFAPYRPNAPLRRNRFQIPEPEVSPAEWLPPSALDLVLTPLVAFDLTGTRLGMGGGFYDRSFAFLRDPARSGHRPRLIGLAYEFQRVEVLIRQPWDIPLYAAVTEKTWRVFAESPG